jgi:DNA-binding transcriptional ArsR family regulator
MVYQHSPHPDRLSATFAALADPTRRAILASLIAGEATVQQLAKPFSMSMPAISKHLKVLEKAGLIARSRDAQWRPCRLEAAPLKDVADWAEDFRRFWDESFDRLDAYLQVMKAKENRIKENGIKEAQPGEIRKKEKKHGRKK